MIWLFTKYWLLGSGKVKVLLIGPIYESRRFEVNSYKFLGTIFIFLKIF